MGVVYVLHTQQNKVQLHMRVTEKPQTEGGEESEYNCTWVWHGSHRQKVKRNQNTTVHGYGVDATDRR